MYRESGIKTARRGQANYYMQAQARWDGVPGCRFVSLVTATKISKQSALAVTHYLRDNQHQSPGRPRYALA